MRKQRREFGSVREVRKGSGRWSARYTGTDSQRTSLGTFPSEAEAWRAVRRRQYEIESGQGVPALRKITLSAYIETEYKPRRKVTSSTAELYDNSIRLHIIGDPKSAVRLPSPRLGQMTLDTITPSVVEKWHADREQATGPRACSQAYALLRTVLGMALRDRLVGYNPCQIRGAVKESAERPLIDQAQAETLIAAMPQAHRTAVIVTLWAHLRVGELLGLRRGDIDLHAGTITIERQVRRIGGEAVETPTKTRKVRTIYLPDQALEALRFHLAATSPAMPSDRLFFHTNGEPLADHHLRRSWLTARREVGLLHLHYHDLRHASLTWAAQQGATTKELMRRAGHSTVRASMIYQHAADERDQELARRLSVQPENVAIKAPSRHEGHAKGTGT